MATDSGSSSDHEYNMRPSESPKSNHETDASSITSSQLEKQEWDEIRQKAGVRTEKTNEHGWMNHSKSYLKPVRDHLYSMIEPPSRDKNKYELFGLAKPFPQVTRTGYKATLYEDLKAKANRKHRGHQELHDDEMKMEGDIEKRKKLHYSFSLKDYGPFYRLKTRYHAELAEFLGMLVFLSIGFASSCQHYVGGSSNSNWTALTFTWGFANMAGIYVAGGYSGAHLNPVVTLNLWFFRGFPFRRMFTFWFAQLLGAVGAAAWIFILYYPLLRAKEPHEWSLTTAKVFYATLSDEVPVATAWFNEVTGSALLHCIIFAVGDSHNIAPARGMNALVLGFTVMAMGCSFGYISAFGLNPFRDLGPRLFLSMVGIPNTMWTTKDWWWVTGEITGPLLGGVIGALAYDMLLFDGPESPINFPPDIKKKALKFLIEDIFHPFRKSNFFARKDKNLHGKVQLSGQPAGQAPR